MIQPQCVSKGELIPLLTMAAWEEERYSPPPHTHRWKSWPWGHKSGRGLFQPLTAVALRRGAYITGAAHSAGPDGLGVGESPLRA